MSEYLVYLAGPMTGVRLQKAMAWRQYVKERLPSCFKTRNPLLSEQQVEGNAKIPKEIETGIFGKGKAFTRKDKNDVRRASLVFINFIGATEVSIGTICELAWAYLFGVPTVVVIDRKNVHWHPFIIEMADVIVDNLDDGINAVKALLLDDDMFTKYGQPL